MELATKAPTSYTVQPSSRFRTVTAHRIEDVYTTIAMRRSPSGSHSESINGLAAVVLLPLATLGRSSRRRPRTMLLATSGAVKDRPFFDQAVTAGVKAFEAAELSRVKASSETPSEKNDGWSGEPLEWAESSSLAQKVSTISQSGPVAQFKQFIADRLAGDYDREEIGAIIDSKINSHKVMMFSFSTCPFCLRAKKILREAQAVDVEVYECDLEPDGYAIRAELGKRTGRTSMPSVWLGPEVLLGGCNDGGLGGVATLQDEGKLAQLLEMREALEADPWWSMLLGKPSRQEVTRQKTQLYDLCSQAPPNGVGTPDELQADIEAAAVTLQQSCPSQPARMPLDGVWDLVYCTAPGGSSGKVGPLVGAVTQTFVDDTRFINAVELLGALKVSLEAEREIMDDTSIKVTFKEMAFALLGVEVFRKPAKGSGVWQQRYVDSELRVMNTPSLFVLRRSS